jgi:hypothetical protein
MERTLILISASQIKFSLVAVLIELFNSGNVNFY